MNLEATIFSSVQSEIDLMTADDIVEQVAIYASEAVDIDSPHVLPPPTWVEEILHTATTQYRLWFDKHPDPTLRIRPTAVGEFWPIVYPVDMDVLVSRIPDRAATTRVRIPCPVRPVRESDRVAIENIANGEGTSLLIDFNRRDTFRSHLYMVLDANPYGAKWGGCGDGNVPAM